MIPNLPHLVTTTLLALPAAVAITRKLIQDRKTMKLAEAGSLDDRINKIEKRANTLTDTLKNIVGYQHHGLNE